MLLRALGSLVLAPLRGARARSQHRRGLALARAGALEEAAERLERSLALERAPQTWLDMGDVQRRLGATGKAETAYRAALAAGAPAAVVHARLGELFRQLGRADEAVLQLKRAYEHARAPEITRPLFAALVDLDLCDKALAVAESAVRDAPGSYEANLLLAFAHHKLNDPVRALAQCDVAGAIRADDAELHDLRGAALQELGRLPEALQSYERALALRPDFVLAAFHRGLARLLTGDLGRGWAGYALRLTGAAMREQLAPAWDGSSLAGRTLLVYREQGLGDEIMFASLLPETLASAGQCIVECEPRLQPLFARSFPSATVFASLPDRRMPAALAGRRIDVEAAAGTLPSYLRLSPSAFPVHEGYLKADPDKVARWRARLERLGPGLKVGLAWSGGVRQTRQRLRSIALPGLLSVLRCPGVRFVSLQYADQAQADIDALCAHHGMRVEHWPEAIADYDETAALVCALDLVVSVCTAVVHLAGALGKEAWVLAPRSPEWRYGFQGENMLWYPSVRVFRQQAFGQWDGVIAAVAQALTQRAAAAPAPRIREAGS